MAKYYDTPQDTTKPWNMWLRSRATARRQPQTRITYHPTSRLYGRTWGRCHKLPTLGRLHQRRSTHKREEWRMPFPKKEDLCPPPTKKEARNMDHKRTSPDSLLNQHRHVWGRPRSSMRSSAAFLNTSNWPQLPHPASQVCPPQRQTRQPTHTPQRHSTAESRGIALALGTDSPSMRASQKSSPGQGPPTTVIGHYRPFRCPPPPFSHTQTRGPLESISTPTIRGQSTSDCSNSSDAQRPHQTPPSTLTWPGIGGINFRALSAPTILMTVWTLLLSLALFWAIPPAHAAFATQATVQSDANNIFLEQIGPIYPTAAWVQIEFRLPIHKPLRHAIKMVAATRTRLNQLYQSTNPGMDPIQLTLLQRKTDTVLKLAHDVSLDVASSLTKEVPLPPWTNQSAAGHVAPSAQDILQDLDLSAFDIPSDKGHPRKKTRRDVNAVKVDINLGNPVEALFSGLTNLIHGQSIGKLSHKVTLLIHTVTAMAAQHERLLDLIQQVWEQATAQTLWWTLDEVESLLRQIIHAAAHLAKGRISAAMMSPGQTSHLFHVIDAFASQAGYSIPFSSIFTLFQMPVTSVAHGRRHGRKHSHTWQAFLHAPLVDGRTPFKGFYFPNAPFEGPHSEPFQFSVGRGFLGVTDVLPSEAKAVFISERDVASKCLQFDDTLVCPDIPILKKAAVSCPACLLLGNPTCCEVERVSGPLIPVLRNSRIFAYHRSNTTLAVSCPDRATELFPVQGQTIISLKPGCSASTDVWQHTSPKTSANHSVTLVPLPPFDVWGLLNNSTPLAHRVRDGQTNLTKALASLEAAHTVGWTVPQITILVFCTIVLAAVGPQVNYLACRLISANVRPCPWCPRGSWTSTPPADQELGQLPQSTPSAPQ